MKDERSSVFINLSNGIEFLNNFPRIDGFVRIQSTACEQKRWWPIILDLDYTFLLAVGLGKQVLICDASARKQVPRAVFQGVEWIQYVLSRRWTNREFIPVVRGHDCLDYFRQCYEEDSSDRKNALKKLDYVERLCYPVKVDISTLSRQTLLDGKYGQLRGILVASACNR